MGFWINQEPSDNGVLDVYSPQNVIMGKGLAYENHCKFRFGYYVESHGDCNITNYMEELTVSDICLGHTANFQRSYKIFP